MFNHYCSRGSYRVADFSSVGSRGGSAHLERSEPEFKHQTLPLTDVLRGEGEDRVVDPEERDQQQRGSSKPPGNTCMDQGVSWHHSPHSNETGLGPMSRRHSQVNTGLIPTNVGGLKLLYENDDDADEEHKVDLQETK